MKKGISTLLFATLIFFAGMIPVGAESVTTSGPRWISWCLQNNPATPWGSPCGNMDAATGNLYSGTKPIGFITKDGEVYFFGAGLQGTITEANMYFSWKAAGPIGAPEGIFVFVGPTLGESVSALASLYREITAYSADSFVGRDNEQALKTLAVALTRNQANLGALRPITGEDGRTYRVSTDGRVFYEIDRFGSLTVWVYRFGVWKSVGYAYRYQDVPTKG